MGPSASSCRCSALVKVDTHTAPPDCSRPERRRREIGERLADPGPGLGQQQVGRALRAASGANTWVTASGHCALAFARLGAAGQPVEPRARLGGIDQRRSAAAAARRLRPIAAGARTACARPGPADRAGPRPAAPIPSPAGAASRWTSTRPRARASPNRRARRAAAPRSLERGRRFGFARRRLQAERAAEPAGGRHREARRMDEGEQLEQVEPGQVGIAEPLPDQRRVEDDVRRFGGARDRLAARRFAHLSVAVRQPNPRMGCVQRGKRQGTHARTLGQSGTKMERGISL